MLVSIPGQGEVGLKEPRSNKWIIRFQPNPRARLRLFCFPFAGGGASAYRLWPRGLPPEVEVCGLQPPGREERWREAAFTEIPRLVSALHEALQPELGTPFAFYGHSMGAKVGYELARRLEAEHQAVPKMLFVSGHPAPHLSVRDAPLAHLPDERLVEAIMHRYGAIPRAVLEDRGLLEMVVHALRSDISALESYTYVPGPRLRCPVVAYAGDGDLVRPELISPWGEQTEGRFSFRVFSGDHFFLNAQREELLAEVARELCAVLATLLER